MVRVVVHHSKISNTHMQSRCYYHREKETDSEYTLYNDITHKRVKLKSPVQTEKLWRWNLQCHRTTRGATRFRVVTGRETASCRLPPVNTEFEIPKLWRDKRLIYSTVNAVVCTCGRHRANVPKTSRRRVGYLVYTNSAFKLAKQESVHWVPCHQFTTSAIISNISHIGEQRKTRPCGDVLVRTKSFDCEPQLFSCLAAELPTVFLQKLQWTAQMQWMP